MAVSWSSVPWGDLIKAGAEVGTAIANRRADARVTESVVNQRQDQNQLGAYQTDVSKDIAAANAETQAKLDRALGMLKEYETALSAPQARASNAVRGDLLANVQDVTVSHPRANVVQFEGGLRPSLLSANSRALGKEMSREALLSQMAGTPTPYSEVELPDFASIRSRSAPELTDLPQPSGFDRTMEGIGTYAGIAAAIQEALKNQTPTTAAQIAANPPRRSRPTPGLPRGIGTVAKNPNLDFLGTGFRA